MSILALLGVAVGSSACAVEVSDIEQMRDRCDAYRSDCQDHVRSALFSGVPKGVDARCDWSALSEEGQGEVFDLGSTEVQLCARWKSGYVDVIRIDLDPSQVVDITGLSTDMLRLQLRTSPDQRGVGDVLPFAHTGNNGIAAVHLEQLNSVVILTDPFYGKRSSPGAASYSLNIASNLPITASDFSFIQCEYRNPTEEPYCYEDGQKPDANNMSEER
jgi:hypothetical protein